MGNTNYEVNNNHTYQNKGTPVGGVDNSVSCQNQELQEQLKQPMFSRLNKQITEKPTSPMELANPNFSPKKQNQTTHETSAEPVNIDMPYSPDMFNYQIQQVYDDYVLEKLAKINNKELKIKIRIKEAKFLIEEFTKIADSLKKEETTSLDAYKDIVEKFQRVHFPELCKENKSIITYDKNPFPETVELDNVSKEQIDTILEKLDTIIEQETNALTHLSRELRQTTEYHLQISAITANQKKNNEKDTMIRHMGQGN